MQSSKSRIAKMLRIEGVGFNRSQHSLLVGFTMKHELAIVCVRFKPKDVKIVIPAVRVFDCW